MDTSIIEYGLDLDELSEIGIELPDDGEIIDIIYVQMSNSAKSS